MKKPLRAVIIGYMLSGAAQGALPLPAKRKEDRIVRLSVYGARRTEKAR